MSALAKPGHPHGDDHDGGHPLHGDHSTLLTPDQLAARWQVPKSHVYRMAREGRVPVVSIGRYYRFRVDAIEEWELATGARGTAEPSRGQP